MSYQGVTHIALRVEDLQKAEVFYRTLFWLKVAFYEAETSDGWRALPQGKSWADAQAAGIELDLVMLYREGFVLALARTDALTIGGALDHIGLWMDEEEIFCLRKQATDLGCKIRHDRPLSIVFEDPYQIKWEISTYPYDDPPSLSNSAQRGRWLKLQD